MAADNRNLWDTVKELVLEQYKGSPKFLAMLQAVIEESVQPLDGCAVELADALDVYKAEGALLDVIGKLVCTVREYGETDEDFRARIIGLANENRAGTPDKVIENVSSLSNDPSPQYMDEAPATFIVYDGPRPDGDGGWEQGGRQLTRKQVKKMAPAGVLGLPGAALKLADGSLLGTSNEGQKKILLVAASDDKTPIVYEFDLVDENGDYLCDENDNILIGKFVLN